MNDSEHLKNILKILEYEDYDENTAHRLYVYCQYHGLSEIFPKWPREQTEREMEKVNWILDND